MEEGKAFIFSGGRLSALSVHFSAAVFGALAGAMLVFPMQAADAALQALALWAQGIMPVLGPFMICMLMLSGRMGGGPWLRLMMGWLCGSPGGARLLGGMGLGKRAARRFAALSGTMSPMFFLGTISRWTGDPRAGAIILFSHLAGALVTGLMLPGDRERKAVPPAPLSFSGALSQGANALLVIALCMMLGGIGAKMVACALPGLPPWAAVILQCALEVTGGVQALIQLHPPALFPLICGACSFGGLSILMQNAAFWQGAGVKMGQLFALRCLHGAVSFGICWAIVKIL